MKEPEEIKSEERQENIEGSMFDISFQHEGKEYKGWARPSGKNDEGGPKSFHVVLNGVFFGNLSFNQNEWEASTQREQSLVQKVGKQLENKK